MIDHVRIRLHHVSIPLLRIGTSGELTVSTVGGDVLAEIKVVGGRVPLAALRMNATEARNLERALQQAVQALEERQ